MSSRKRLGKNHASNWKTRWFAINRKSDPVAYAWQSPKRGRRQIWLRAWRTDWACAIFDKITAVYGQIIKNWLFVRKFEWNLGLISWEKLFANRLHCSAFNLFQKKNGTFYRPHPGQKSYNDWFIFIISAPKMSSARKCSFDENQLRNKSR